jgi:hypothetical protein
MNVLKITIVAALFGLANIAGAQTINSTSSAAAGSQSASQAASVSQGGGGGSASANNQGNTLGVISYGSDLSRAHKNTPSVVAPALTTTLTETCHGSTTAGGSGAGFGLAFGSTWKDEECIRRLHARELRAMGQSGVSMQVMCGSDVVADAARLYAERTAGVDQCTGENYAQVELGPDTPQPAESVSAVETELGIGPVPLLGPDISAAPVTDEDVVVYAIGNY